MIFLALLACSKPDAAPSASSPDLMDRAYVVSNLSNELFVFDYDTLDEVGSLDTTITSDTPNGNHMAMVSMDGTKIYISAAEAGQLVVVDAATLTLMKTIPIGTHATHMAFRPDSDELWIMAEGDDAIVVLDTVTDTVTHTITDPSLHTPHFARFSEGYDYTPSIGGNKVSVIDLATYSVVDTLVGEGLEEGGCDGDPCGYADAQIDANGMLFASNFTTGKVIVYDTLTHERLPDVSVGVNPWSAFVDPFAADEDFAFVPSWADSTVSRISGDGLAKIWAAGDSQVYGVNFSAQAPDEAFVLSRTKEQVSVLDRNNGDVLDTLDVGGTTETATTTTDGRLLLPISSTGEVAVYDTATHEELARFEDVGTYPWSVTTAEGQNYCH